MSYEMIEAFVRFRVAVETFQLLQLFVRRREGFFQGSGRRLKRLHLSRLSRNVIDHLGFG